MTIRLLSEETAINGHKIFDATKLPGFEVLKREGYTMEARHKTPYRFHIDYLKFEQEVFSVTWMSNTNKGFRHYGLQEIETAVLRNAFGDLEGKIIPVAKPLPKAFGKDAFQKTCCPSGKRNLKTTSVQAIFERAEDADGTWRREGSAIVYFFARWREHPLENKLNP